MKKVIKKYRGLVLLVALFVFSLHINAVFEGRNGNLEQYQSVRNQVDVSSINQKAYNDETIDPDGGDDDDDNKLQFPGPISDSPLFFLLLGAVGCGAYIFVRQRKIIDN